MKLQLDENTLNAYINEAIRQEINEGVWNRIANFATRRAAGAAQRAAAKNAPRVITHSPITKKFFGRIKDAKSARKFIMGLRRGKVVSGTVEAGKGAKGLQWFTKDGKKFFTDAACTQQITDPKKLGAVTRSFNGHYTAAANLLNSAQRNMLGTGLVAGMGAGWAIDHNAHKDDPWNATEPEPGNENVPDDNGGFNGEFPWDNTTPEWSPRPRRRTPNPNPNPEPTPTPENTPGKETPAQPERPRAEQLAPLATPAGIPTGVTVPQETPAIRQPEHNESYVDSARRVMAQTAAAGLNGNTGNPRLDNWQATNRNTRRTAIDGVNRMQASGAMSPEDARAGRRAIRQTERNVRRNGRRAQRQGQ